jgi:flagellar biosynthesis protein FliQ
MTHFDIFSDAHCRKFLKFYCIFWVNVSYFRHFLAVVFILYVMQLLSNINCSGSEFVPKLICCFVNVIVSTKQLVFPSDD